MSVKDDTKILSVLKVTGTLLFTDQSYDTLRVDFSKGAVIFNAPIVCALCKDDVAVLHEKLTLWLSSQE